ncbi:hypothetical protein ILP97_57480 [Amycolatopsis sp. H6(2020)]|nr:hypothetical protein [Amycolatopsis sp. H6(2020)]
MFVLLCCASDPEPVARLLHRRARETPAGPQPSLINRTVAPHGQDPRTELRAVLDSPIAAAWAVLDAVRAGADRIAVGAGPVILDGEQADGVGLGRARRAFDEGPGIRVQGADPVLDEAAAALLELAARLIRERSAAQWRVVDLMVPGVRGQHAEAARALGISPQAVSRALIRTGWAEQVRAADAAAALLERTAA